MRITGGAYEFALPVGFLPNYKSYKELRILKEEEMVLEPSYTFQYSFNVVSNKKITFLGVPKGARTITT
jgi:hypothetical protein